MTNEDNLFAGRYRKLYKLGQGGMGQVWRCKDTYLDIDVAIKLLHKDDSVDSITRFQTEARSLAALKHRNVVGILDFGFTESNLESGQEEEKLYMVMEYLSGSTLSDILKEEGKLSIAKTLSIISQVLDGLRHAHGQGLIHRDLKPSNILVSEDDGGLLVKIVDFGTAKYSKLKDGQDLTRTGVIVGTPLYISPEVAGGAPADERSDLYSAGCILFHCLTGHVPYRGENAASTLMMHLEAPLPELPEEVDEELRDCVFSCLSKDPEQRVQSADELLQNLITYSDSLNADDFPLIKTESPGTSKPSTRIYLVLLAGLLLAGLLAYGFKSYLFSEGESALNKPISGNAVSSSLLVAPPSFESKPSIRDRGGGCLKASKAVDDNFVAAYLNEPGNVDTGSWNLSDTRVSSAVFEHINPATLTGLSIDRTGIDQRVFSYLKKADRLVNFEMRSCSLLDARGLSEISDLPRLRSLAVTVGGDTGEWMGVLSRFKHLNSLTIEGKLKKGDLLKLKDLPDLVRLALLGATAEEIAEVQQLKHVNYLVLNGKLEKQTMKVLASCPLKVLDISACELNPVDYDTGFNIITGPEMLILDRSIDRGVLKRLKLRNSRVKFEKAN